MLRFAISLCCLVFLAGCATESERLEKRLSAHPSDIETLYQLGLAYRQERRFEESAHTLDRVAALEPGHPYALNEAGISYGMAKMYEPAMERLKKQIALNDDPFAHSSLGSIYSDLMFYPEAEPEIRKAIDGGLVFDGNFLLALLRFRQLRTQEARDALEAARPHGQESRLVGGWEGFAALDQLLTLNERAERLAGGPFVPPFEIPKTSIQARARFVSETPQGHQICRLETVDGEWKIQYGLLLPDRDYEIVEIEYEFLFDPIKAKGTKGKVFVRRFVTGRPPCWCAWHDCGKSA